MSNVGQKERKTQARVNAFSKYSVIQNTKNTRKGANGWVVNLIPRRLISMGLINR